MFTDEIEITIKCMYMIVNCDYERPSLSALASVSLVAREQASVVGTRCSPRDTCLGLGHLLNNFCREMVLSKDLLHFRNQRIDISYRFNFGYYWFNINKV